MREIFLPEVLFAVLTGLAYFAGKYIYKKVNLVFLHSVITATVLVILFCYVADIDMKYYEEHTKGLRYLLNLSVVAFGYLLFKHYEYIRQKGVAIFAATFTGSLAAIVTTVVPAFFLGANYQTIVTLMPKSVTNPIAIVISEQHGGLVYLTAVMVIIAGIFGAVTGPWFLKITGIKSPLAKGLSLGSASHGIGTAKALEMGALEGAAGGLAIALMGLFTSLLVPVFAKMLKLLEDASLLPLW